MARIGAEDQKIITAPLDQMTSVDLGGPLHSLVIPGNDLHPIEKDMLRQFALNKEVESLLQT